MLRRGVWNFGSDFVYMFIAFSFVLRVGTFCQECEYDRKAARYSALAFAESISLKRQQCGWRANY